MGGNGRTTGGGVGGTVAHAPISNTVATTDAEKRGTVVERRIVDWGSIAKGWRVAMRMTE